MQAAYLRRVQPSKRSTSLPKGYAVMGAVAAMLVVFAVLFALNRPPESAGVPSPTMTATFISTPTAIPTPTRTDTSTATTTATTTVTLTFTPSLAPSPGETQAAVAPTVESAVTSASVTVPLWAGQTINAGRVVISNDAANLYVTYQTSPEWLLQQTHIDLRNEAPVNSENLAPGQFAYKTDPHAPQVSEFTYTIPLDALNGEIIILSHASLIGVGSRQGEDETAWGGDISGAARRWYFYTIYTLQH
jgi:hypothetical protein